MEDIPRTVLFLAYAVGFGASLAVAVPLSLLLQNFGEHCMLYAHGEWVRDSAGVFLNVSSWGPISNCVFPQFSSISFIIAAAMFMGWSLYLMYKNAESSWCATFVVLTVSGAFAVLQLIAAACISGGLNVWCSVITAGPLGFPTCSAADGSQFFVHSPPQADTPVSTLKFFTLIKTAEVGCWIAWLACVAATLASSVALRKSEQSGGGGGGFLSSLRNERDRLVRARHSGGRSGGGDGHGRGYAAI